MTLPVPQSGLMWLYRSAFKKVGRGKFEEDSTTKVVVEECRSNGPKKQSAGSSGIKLKETFAFWALLNPLLLDGKLRSF